MKGILIAIEGSDGSGKATQSRLLCDRLVHEGKNALKIEFPNYNCSSSSMVKMYLNGEFGNNPEDVSPYVASTFYAVDRYASYKKAWGIFYNNGGIIIADRYTPSNMIHQGAKIKDKKEKQEFLDWLLDFEFGIFGLPVPDYVFFLDMPPEYSIQLLDSRVENKDADDAKDIHEKSLEHLTSSYNNGYEIAEFYKWHIIKCVENGKLRSIDEIHNEIYEAVRKKLIK
ncbi:MAG TPA: thymidylate kinase [Clostridiales bacterium]|nr:thymidylate kinase [Clostridiales bacterium]